LAAKSEQYTQQDRDFAIRRGDELNQQAKDRSGVARNRRANQMGWQEEVYGPMMTGGGYSPEEAAAIQGDYGGIATTPEEYQSNLRTQQEQNDFVGDPWSRAAYFDKDAMEAQTAGDSDRVRGAMGGYRSDVQGALDPYGKNLRGAIGDEAAQSIDPEYTAYQKGVIGRTGSDRRAAVDPALLRADAGALDTIRMSPEEYQQTLTAGGNVIGEGYRAATDDVTRRARAAGVNPLGMGAMRDRMERSSAADRGDAMLKAKVAAGAARAGRAGTAEEMRLHGEESASDRMARAAMEAGDFEFKGRFGMEDQRLAAEKAKQGARLQVESELGRAGLGAASELGKAGLGVEEGAAQRAQQQRQYGTTLGTEMATGIERDTQARKAANTMDRQAQVRANQGQRYGQGMGIQEAKRSGALQVAEGKRADQREARNWLNTSTAQSAAEEQADYDREHNAYSQQGGQMQGTTQAQANRDAQPKWYDKVISAGIGAVGAASGAGLIGGATKAATKIAPTVAKTAFKNYGYDPYGDRG
jgi:hypothetical protein